MLRVRYEGADKQDLTRIILKEIWNHALGVIAGHSGAKTTADICFLKDSGMLALKKNGEVVCRLPDVLDSSAIEEAFIKDEGPLSIIASGLFMYLTDTDTGIFFDSVQRLLNEKGGCLITPDPESARFFMSVWQALCSEHFIDYLMETDDTRLWKDDLQIDNIMVIDPRWDYERLCERARSFLSSHGLSTGLIPADRYLPEYSWETDALSLSKDELKRALNTLSYWKITPCSDGAGYEKHFTGRVHSFSSRLYGKTLILKLAGRVDSQSAPMLSGLYDEYKDVCSRVEIHCADLKYISSAGLRLLIRMAKRCAVSMYGVNETVGEILSQTGLDALLDISSDRIDT